MERLLTTIDPAEPVELRMNVDGMGAEPPATIPEFFLKIAEEYPDHPALSFEDEDSHEWKTVNYSEYKFKVEQLSKAFIQLGLEPHHSVGILAYNSPEWFFSELAAIFARGLSVGIYTTNSAEAVRHILHTSRANIVVVDDEKQMAKVKSIKDQLPLLKAVIQLYPPFNSELRNEDGFFTWTDLEEMDLSSVEDTYSLRLSQIIPNQAAAVIFTSGTVGMPKGALISHDTLIWNAKQIDLTFGSPEKGTDVLVCYLPLSHVAGQCLDVFYAFFNAATVFFADKNALKGTLIKTLRHARPTRLMGVPRVYEKFQAAIMQQSKVPFWKQHVLNWSKYYSLEYYLNIGAGNQQKKTWQYKLARNTILKRAKSGLGLDRCASCVVGSAPVSIDVKKFFMSLDLPLLECFGMSEVGGPSCFSQPNAFRVASVGRAIPGMTVKIDNPDESGNGEVLFKGRNVFMGYIGDEDKTREALDEDGWLHTGDVGHIDKDGFIYITGRMKELIITAGGENIPPVHVEDLVKKELSCVSNAFLVGEQRKYLTMLITLKTEMDTDSGAPLDKLSLETVTWLNGLGISSYNNLSEILAAGPCPEVKREIEAGIARANKNAISSAQKVQKFEILDHDFSIPTGELGPTLKLKRNIVVKMYSDVINKMYE